MGKLKEALAEIVEYFDWERFIIGFCLAFALCAFILGVVLSIAHGNLAWITLWVISMIAVAVVMGVDG
jgi:lysylphosphatidylglycerol synthetase-like protein (DUF2156 family)